MVDNDAHTHTDVSLSLPGEPGGWERYQIFVLSEIRRLTEELGRTNSILRDSLDRGNSRIGEIEHEFTAFRASVDSREAAQKATAGLWGAVAASVPTAVGVAVVLLS